MDKRWYPVAVSIAIVSCGGDVDSGGPGATGGRPNVHYGVGYTAGGSVGIDAGIPGATGGLVPMPPYGIMPMFTGGSAGIAGAATSGGTLNIDSGVPGTTGGFPTIIYGIR
jgi:hypothetical protein